MDFDFGRTIEKGWQIGDDIWLENPRLILPPWVWPVVDLWRACRAHASPMGGRPLPCGGGVGEQPAALIDAFTLLDGMLHDAPK